MEFKHGSWKIMKNYVYISSLFNDSETIHYFFIGPNVLLDMKLWIYMIQWIVPWLKMFYQKVIVHHFG